MWQYRRTAAFNDADAATAARLAAGTGTGIANALTLMRHRFIADTLQRSCRCARPPGSARGAAGISREQWDEDRVLRDAVLCLTTRPTEYRAGR